MTREAGPEEEDYHTRQLVLGCIQESQVVGLAQCCCAC